MRIREGRSSDIEACVRILRDSPEYFTEEGVRQAERHLGGQSTLVAVDGARVVGFATAVRKSREVAEIVALAVAPAWRRRGVGGRLVERCAYRLRRDGTVRLEAKTLAEESGYCPYEGVRRFYRANGFRPLETIDSFPGWQPGHPCAIYVRILGRVARRERAGGAPGRGSGRPRTGRRNRAGG